MLRLVSCDEDDPDDSDEDSDEDSDDDSDKDSDHRAALASTGGGPTGAGALVSVLMLLAGLVGIFAGALTAYGRRGSPLTNFA